MFRAMVLLSSFALAACMQDSPLNGDGLSPSCAAPELQELVGQPLTELDETSLPQPYRIIAPDMAVTMDWNPARLNIEHDEANVITRIACG